MLAYQIVSAATVAIVLALVAVSIECNPMYGEPSLASLDPLHSHTSFSGSAFSKDRIKSKLNHLMQDPKVIVGIESIKPTIGKMVSIAKPAIQTALYKADEWKNRPVPGVQGYHGSNYGYDQMSSGHYGVHGGAYGHKYGAHRVDPYGMNSYGGGHVHNQFSSHGY